MLHKLFKQKFKLDERFEKEEDSPKTVGVARIWKHMEDQTRYCGHFELSTTFIL